MEFRAYLLRGRRRWQVKEKLHTTMDLFQVTWECLSIEGKRDAEIMVLCAPDLPTLELMSDQILPAPQVRIGSNIKTVLRMRGFKL